MSSTIFLLTLLSVIVIALSDDREEDEMYQQFEEYRKECSKETGFDGPIIPSKFTQMSEPAKCYVSCMAQKSGELTKDGINMDKVKENLHKIMKDAPEQEKILEVMDKCAKELQVIEDNLCETAYQFLICQYRMFNNQA